MGTPFGWLTEVLSGWLAVFIGLTIIRRAYLGVLETRGVSEEHTGTARLRVNPSSVLPH